jgi:hypothetical protein
MLSAWVTRYAKRNTHAVKLCSKVDTNHRHESRGDALPNHESTVTSFIAMRTFVRTFVHMKKAAHF